MPWRTTGPMEEKLRFIRAAQKKRLRMVELCALFGVAPKTGYKWLRRFEQAGLEGLKEQSRRPRSNSRGISERMADELLELRCRHPTWGARKLLAWLQVRS